ncbi:ATP-dependent DNA helicase [Hydrogenophaga sp. BPS33]|uniref:ATP-dependent DNA helicase n=1 Tax=Hydrogenophaga sp. BPS33 TaxID=2651974 RepID=UPI00131F8C43|nr:ATP-dependent DNA helicase [Hydrogenophaga sp. BPS33]QHE85810.1 ATP-dependent DNA helicase [Hydrogenophaga sp. BPS33]
MSELENKVAAAFDVAGPLAQKRGAWRERPGQGAMAAAVARAIEAGESLAVEAGTGVGKTLAYLVPVLLSGRKALLSTATQALQDQLFTRDIPLVVRALGLPVRAAVLKGRSSYVCLHRVEQALHGTASSALRDPAIAAGLAQVLRWAQGSRSGDLAELAGFDEQTPWRALITSTRDNCVGTPCPRHAQCHVNRARHEALSAEWVVINHHLFFADQLLQEADVATLLPSAEVVVFDEAHQLNDTGIPLLGHSVDAGALRELARDIAREGPQAARGQQPWAHLALVLEQATRGVAMVPRSRASGARHRWSGACPQDVDLAAWTQAGGVLDQALRECGVALQATSEASPGLRRLLSRAGAFRALWRALRSGAEANGLTHTAQWVEWGAAGQWRVVRAPADASALFQHLLGDISVQRPRSWVFSSATLGGDDALSWFTRGLGLEGMPHLRTLRVPSPFDHAAQAALYVPEHLPEPGDEAHTAALAEAVARWASRLGGRTLVLTTTLRAAAQLAQHLRTRSEQGLCAPLQVLEQGRLSKRALLERFRREADHARVMVASASFWEGVDLVGDALQLLVIDKLPFPPPDDPLMQARGQRFEAQGLSAFDDVWMPHTAMALKQGMGRLIRSESDRGVLVIGDRRLLTRAYGSRLLAALPEMRRLLDEADMDAALDALVLTRSSTTGRTTT